ncbi:MAG: PHP domain-containing protein [Nitrosomonadales bacterium]
MKIIDLHSHSNVSDGLLSPSALIDYANEKKVNMIALTDHDDISGIHEARTRCKLYDIYFVSGVEISVTWRNRTIHIIGLNFDEKNQVLIKGLESIREGRIKRAEKIAYGLEMAGVKHALAGAKSFSQHQVIGRVHFAQYLVQQNYARNIQSVFKKFMTPGKPGYVKHEWAELKEAVEWIVEAGGMPVVAHPGRYDMGGKLYPLFFQEFKDYGGKGIEVISGSQPINQSEYFANFAEQFDLYASIGSDFHGYGVSHRDLGPLHELPINVKPIWQHFSLMN